MNNNLLILGNGRLELAVKEIAEEMNCFAKIDFLSDESESAIGKLSDYEKFSADYKYAYPAFENPEERINWIQRLEQSCYKVAVLVHPKAYYRAYGGYKKQCFHRNRKHSISRSGSRQ